MSLESKEYFAIFKLVDKWIDDNIWGGYDVCDISSQKFYLFLSHVNRKFFFGKYFSFLFLKLAQNKTNTLRKFFRVKKKTFPQAISIAVRSYLLIYKKTNDDHYLKKAIDLLEWLKNNPSQGFKNYCWGQPYDWYSRKLIKKHIPRTTVTTQVANAFLDAYEITGNKEYLEIAESTCSFYIENLNWEEDSDEHICFSYTSKDDYNIHNASMFAAAVLIRTYSYTKNSEWKKMGLKALAFTSKYQNPDGSWYYWAPPDKLMYKIDNYHTGFVLEAYQMIKEYLDDKFEYDEILNKGIEYYKNNLFDNGEIPRMTNKSKFPIDIQSCAQSIITFAEISKNKHEYLDMANSIAKWTITNMFDKEKGIFYYRIKTGNVIDKTPYIRWGETWMLRALCLLIEEKK